MKLPRKPDLRLRWMTNAIACCLIIMLGVDAAWSQVWPTRPTTVIIPFTAGNAIDVSVRLVMEQVSKEVGRPILIDNRPGAGGAIGANAVAKSTPDGHTILASGSLASAHALFENLPYSTLDDFTPVISLGLTPLVVVTGPASGIETLNDLIARAKAKPGTVTFASAGIGSATHLAAERFRVSASFDAQHIPFRGPNEGLTEIMAGRVDFYVVPASAALSLIKDGKVVALAMSATKRAATLPDVPTTTELGLVDSAYSLYSGLFVPSKTHREIVAKIFHETTKALQLPAVQQRLGPLGLEPMPMSQEEFARFFRDDVEGNVRLVRVANIPLQK